MEHEPNTVASRPDKWTLNQYLLDLWFKELLPALGVWEQYKERNQPERGIRELKSIMKTIMWAVKSSLDKELLDRKSEKTTLKLITELSDATEEKEIYSILEQLETFLYKKGVLKWDAKEVQDRTRVWQMNQKFQG